MERILDAGADQFGGEECVEILLDLVAQGRVTEERIDESARRLLLVKFRLGLFDDPYVDEDAAAATVGRADFREAGYGAQAASVTVLSNGGGAAPVSRSRRAADLRRERGPRGRRAATAPRSTARRTPTSPSSGSAPRSSRAPTSSSRRGSTRARSTSRPGLVARLARVAAACPLVVDVTLDRPAVLTPLLPLAAAVVGSYGTQRRRAARRPHRPDPPRGRLPFDLPRSMDQVRAHPEDVPGYDDPLFAFGHGLAL